MCIRKILVKKNEYNKLKRKHRQVHMNNVKKLSVSVDKGLDSKTHI